MVIVRAGLKIADYIFVCLRYLSIQIGCLQPDLNERKTMSLHKSLKSVSSGETVFVIAVDAGIKARTRLESMGIIPGAEISVLNNDRGPMLVSVGEGRVMVESGIAQKVLVA